MEQVTSHYTELLEQRFSNGMLAELQAYPNFVTWTRTKENKQLPLDPNTYHPASSTNPETWGTIDQAIDALRKGHGTGVGFVFADNDPFTGFDLDHCVFNNQITPEAKKIITQFDSYTELSPSRIGLHILVKGNIPAGRRKDSIETYSSGRYFTLTTNHLKTSPNTIEERQSQLDTLYASLSENIAPREVFKSREHQLFIRDEKMLEKAIDAKNGHSFADQYRGNIAGFNSKSEADFTLVLRLLYWTNDDIEQVKRLFRNSGLYDEKTDRRTGDTTYLDKTITNAPKKRAAH